MNIRGQNASFESLETRRLLSSSFASVNSNGTLSVVGTSKADTITVQTSGSKVQAILNGATESLTASTVKRIWADARLCRKRQDQVTKRICPVHLSATMGTTRFQVAREMTRSLATTATMYTKADSVTMNFIKSAGMPRSTIRTIPASTFDLSDGTIDRTRGGVTQTGRDVEFAARLNLPHLGK